MFKLKTSRRRHQVGSGTGLLRGRKTQDTEHRDWRGQLGAHRTPPARPPRIPRGSSRHHPCSTPDGRVERLGPVQAKSGAGPAPGTFPCALQNSARGLVSSDSNTHNPTVSRLRFKCTRAPRARFTFRPLADTQANSRCPERARHHSMTSNHLSKALCEFAGTGDWFFHPVTSGYWSPALQISASRGRH